MPNLIEEVEEEKKDEPIIAYDDGEGEGIIVLYSSDEGC
jgi:hypothetical protein